MAGLSLTNSISVPLAGLTALFLIWLIMLTEAVRRQAKARRKLLAALKDEKDVPEILAEALNDIDRLFEGQEQLQVMDRNHRGLISESVRHIGVVRYDAFPEVGGRLSFSAALLNEAGDGVVITSINGRSDSRVYAKTIEERRSSYNLSEEEQQAINMAFKGVNV